MNEEDVSRSDSGVFTSVFPQRTVINEPLKKKKKKSRQPQKAFLFNLILTVSKLQEV